MSFRQKIAAWNQERLSIACFSSEYGRKVIFFFSLHAFWASKLTLYWSWAVLNRCYSSMVFTALSLSRSFPVFIYEPERIGVRHLKIVSFFFFACSILWKSWSHNWMTFSVHQLHLYIAQIMLAYVKSYESVT